MIGFIIYFLSALGFLVSTLSFQYLFDGKIYAIYFPTITADFFKIGMLIANVFGVLGCGLSQLETLEKFRMAVLPETKSKSFCEILVEMPD